ncbi:hypothetical protein CTAYLR_004585 [Chrysophaeum taylorii]|uniref:F-box domain-containing protein n=1 Tax=Chrysophaeum taylorii TaxID=2483200 RepID=A0AAD7XKP3_9STRA|nr:hypothetical protein CTAYLR_004585 [Chrysophaeum taylorii]
MDAVPEEVAAKILMLLVPRSLDGTISDKKIRNFRYQTFASKSCARAIAGLMLSRAWRKRVPRALLLAPDEDYVASLGRCASALAVGGLERRERADLLAAVARARLASHAHAAYVDGAVFALHDAREAMAAGWGLSGEVLLGIMEFVDGASALRASVALRPWRQVLVEEAGDEWWRERIVRELRAPALRSSPPPFLSKRGWRGLYRELVEPVERARWVSASSRHGLTDRVAAPQMFVGPSGKRLFCYGGWTRLGPQTDVHWANLGDIAGMWRRAKRGSGVARGVGPRFRRALETGRPVGRGGVQTLTPLWVANGGREGPSRRHVAATVGTEEVEEDAELVLAFGGAGGGYHNEHNDWRVAALTEGEGDRNAAVCWTAVGRRRIGPSTRDGAELAARCAHAATYVPARLCGASEGAVFVVGGHADDCSRSLASVDCLDVATWTWDKDVAAESNFRPRHGHSSTLVEEDGTGYLVVVGGGNGNILHGFGAGIRELDDVNVFDTRSRRWIATFDSAAPFGRHHAAATLPGGRALLFGGGARPSNEIGLLDARACVKRALHHHHHGQKKRAASSTWRSLLFPTQPAVFLKTLDSSSSDQPRPRKMHASACLLPWLPLFVVFGGWEMGPHFADMWFADLHTSSSTADDDDGMMEVEESAEDEDTTAATGAADPDDDDDDDDDDDNDDSLVTLNIATNAGTHQIQVPRHVFLRLVREGMLGVADEVPPAAAAAAAS